MDNGSPPPRFAAGHEGDRAVGPAALIALALVSMTMLIGGGGTPAPAAELAIELCALAVLCLYTWLPATSGRRMASDPPLSALTIALIGIVTLQLVPLPPPLWQNLPGRAVERDALALIGQSDAWMPWSLSPSHTLAGLLAMIPPITLLWIMRTLGPAERMLPAVGIVAAALVGALVGAVQVMSNGAVAEFYKTIPGYAVGFQANRNSAADLWLIALAALAALAVGGGRDRFLTATRAPRAALAWALALLFAVAVVLSGSRTGVVMLAVLAASLAASRVRSPNRRLAILLGLGLVLIGLFAVLASGALPMIDRTLERFALHSGGRIEMWEDAVYQIRASALTGTGIGSGSLMLVAAEQLQSLDAFVPNRAHNDYLEFLLETGVAGGALLIAGIVFIGTRLRRMCRDPDQRTAAALAAAIFAIVAVHSLVDYPLRSISIATLTAYAFGLIARPAVVRNLRRAAAKSHETVEATT